MAIFVLTGTIYDSYIFTTNEDDVVTDAAVHGPLSDLILGGGDDLYIATHDASYDRGYVRTGLGNDTVNGNFRGEIFYLDENDDHARGRGGNDIISGGSGNDRLLGDDGYDRLSGDTGADQLMGGTGNDTIYGDLGADIVVGEDGRDFLYGGEDDDIVDGGNDNDYLFGDSGEDRLRGRDGDDVLNGSWGRDILLGGPGADEFVYTNASHSTPDDARDEILDFEIGIDKIDLSWLSIDASGFRGTDRYTASGTAELRLQEVQEGSTIIRMDLDGNGTTDMEIRTVQVQGLTVDDFML